MKTDIVKVTPALAKEWLEQADNFRKPHEPTIDRLARDMTAGKWDENGETIKFNTKDELIDGQHRLMACIRADRPFTTAVMYDVKSDLNIDVGRKRSLADYLEYHYKVGGYSIPVAAALRQLSAMRKGYAERQAVPKENGVLRVATNNELVQLFRKETDIVESVKLAHPVNKLIPCGVMGALLVLFREKDKELATRFVNGLMGKLTLETSDPVVMLRDKLLSDRGSKYKMGGRMKLALTIIAWNHWRKGTSTKILKFVDSGPSAMEFPEIQ